MLESNMMFFTAVRMELARR